MGNYFQTLVDRDIPIAAAEGAASKIVRWLIDRGVIEPRAKDCVLSRDKLGYPPGLNYRDVIDLPAGCDDYTLDTLTNGLEIEIGRQVFYTTWGLTLVCRKCSGRVDGRGDDAWSQAVGEWYHEKGADMFACPACGHAEPVTEWTYDPPWGFGNLGFTFWNWPPLRPSFVTELSERLGHRTVLVRGKL